MTTATKTLTSKQLTDGGLTKGGYVSNCNDNGFDTFLGDPDLESYAIITYENLAAVAGCNVSDIISVTVNFKGITNGTSSMSICSGSSSVYGNRDVFVESYPSGTPSTDTVTGINRVTQVSCDADTANDEGIKYGLIQQTYLRRVRVESIEVTITCSSITSAEVCDPSTSEWQTSDLTISKPQSISFRGICSCSDASCGTVTDQNWAVKKGSTILDSGSGTSTTYTGFDEATTYTYVQGSSCGTSSSNATVNVTISSPVQTKEIKYNSDTYVNVTEGSTYKAPAPREIGLNYEDTWGGYYTLYIGVREHDSGSAYSYTAASSSNPEEVEINYNVTDSTKTYDVIYCYGNSSDKTKVVEFIIGVDAVSESYKYKKATDANYSTVTTGSTYDVNVGTNDGINVDFKYESSYGSNSYQLGIVIDGSIPSGYTASTTSITKRYKFTTNGNHAIQYVYSTDGWTTSNYTVVCSFTITTRGIVTGEPYLYVANERVYNSSKELAQYNPTDVVIVGLEGIDVGNITYEWSVGGTNVSSSYYTFTPNVGSPSGSIKLKQVSYNGSVLRYTITCTVKSYTVPVKTVNFGTGNITCKGKTVAVIGYLTPMEGDTNTTFRARGNCYIPTDGGQTGLGGSWYIKDDGGRTLVAGTDYTVISSSYESPYNIGMEFKMRIVGSFTLYLKTNASGSLVRGEDSVGEFNIANVITMDLPSISRFSVIIYNDTYECVLNRTNSDTLFDQLEFSSGLNKVGSASFNVIGGNNLKCTRSGTRYNASSLLTNGTHVIIVDNLVPIWTGIITGVSAVNLNFYNSKVETSVLNVKCTESLKELSYVYTNSSTYNGTINSIVESLLYVNGSYDYRGTISQSTVKYAMSFDVSSVLTALDSISSQVGWRYRCRPRIYSYGNNITKNGNTYTVSSTTNIHSGDYIIIYDSAIPSSGTVYAEASYHVAKINSVSGSTVSFSSYHTLPSANGTYKFAVTKGFVVDFKPAYYQDYATVSLKINDTAQNVNEVETSSDKFGEVSVYGVGNSGETISSTMRAWMVVNADYTIPNSARISESYDSTIDTITLTRQYVLGDYTWSEFSVVLNGWSFPISNSFSFGSHQPTIYYKTSLGNIRAMHLRTDSGPMSTNYIKRYTDQTGMKKTVVTCAYRVAMADGSTIPSNDSHYLDAYDASSSYSDARLFADILSSLSSLTNVIFNIVKLTADNTSVATVIPNSGYVRIGDTRVTSSGYSDVTNNFEFNWISGTIPHGHMTDVLVIDDSGTKYPSGYSYNTPSPNSPYIRYPNTKKTIQGAEGYSAMELERLACRYMQYGSNYNARGSADVVYQVFRKSDYNVGCKRILSVGDRIQFQKVNSVSGSTVVYDLTNFELVSYDIKLSNNSASITFGMPFIEIGDVIYNMLANSGMSIIPADTSSTST